MKVHYPKLYNMAHLLSLNVFTASKGSNNYILFVCFCIFYFASNLKICLFNKYMPEIEIVKLIHRRSLYLKNIYGYSLKYRQNAFCKFR